MSLRLPSGHATPVLLCALALAGCGGDSGGRGGDQPAATPTGRQDTLPGSSFGAPTRIAARTRIGADTLQRFRTPESIKYDPELDVWFVSNIGGNPSAKDNDGFIVSVPADNVAEGDGAVVVAGGQEGVTLNAPKGLEIVGDTLWVTDIDAVRAFDKRSGAPLGSVAVRGARFLNDIVAGGDGSLYITDTGIRFSPGGEMSHPGPDRIFRIRGRTASVAATFPAGVGPNGITWDAEGGRFIVVSFAKPTIFSWKPGSAPTQLATGPGSFDGVEVLGDGRIIVSSWADSSVHVVRDTTVERLFGGVPAPADIGLNTRLQHVAVPLFMENRLEFWAIP